MATANYLTLFELQTILRDRIESAVPNSVWVTAEISEIKVNRSGHCYIELIEKETGERNPKAKVNAVIWRSTFGSLGPYFEAEAGQPLGVGMKILVRVAVSYHELYGLSLTIGDIDPVYTVGDMEKQRRATIERLKAEGIWNINRELELPVVPRRLAVVSSRQAAGFRDFIKELEGSPYAFEVTLFESLVQGAAAEATIVDAFEKISWSLKDFDVVVLIRGGGSQSELALFDSYEICCHVAQFPLPVLTGIGHDKDCSIADMVAAVSLKTPTAVAGWLIDEMAGFERWLLESRSIIQDTAAGCLREGYDMIGDMAGYLYRQLSVVTRKEESRLTRMAETVKQKTLATVTGQSSKLSAAVVALPHAVTRAIAGQHRKLDYLGKIVEANSPGRILSLGFSIVRRNGQAVRDAETLGEGMHVDIVFEKGSATAEIKTIDNGR